MQDREVERRGCLEGRARYQPAGAAGGLHGDHGQALRAGRQEEDEHRLNGAANVQQPQHEVAGGGHECLADPHASSQEGRLMLLIHECHMKDYYELFNGI